MICLALTESTIGDAVSVASANRDHFDSVELRADFLAPSEAGGIGRLPSLLERAGVRVPVILTLRRAAEGGKWNGSDEDRLARIARALRTAREAGAPFAFVDLEHDLSREAAVEVEGEIDATRREPAARPGRTRIIRSFHDIHGTPDDIGEIMRSLARSADEIPKAAVMCRSTRDLRLLLEVAAALSRDRCAGTSPEWILLGMGDYGVASRILAGRYGSFLTFCSVPGKSAAPGHIDPATLDTLYAYRGISDRTAVFCVIGNPVMHSGSPRYHNSRFRSDDLDAVYLPIQVDDVEEFFTITDLVGILGASVTIPHKETVIPRLASADATVESVGACNTLTRGPKGWNGTNTDVPGFLRPLIASLERRARLDPGTNCGADSDAGSGAGGGAGRRQGGNPAGPLAGKRATVIGAGGAARGIVYGLLSSGAEVCVLNRTPARAEALANDFHGIGAPVRTGPLDEAGCELAKSFCDVIVQTTSVGMHPDENADPFPLLRFTGNEIVCDIIYTPEETHFLRRARDAGCVTVTGRGMFDEQAAEQYSLFRALVR